MKLLKGISKDYVRRGIYFIAPSSRLRPLSYFVNTLKVSVDINWPQIRGDGNEASPFRYLGYFGLRIMYRDFFAMNLCKLSYKEISSLNGVTSFIFDNIMPSHQVNYDFNLIESFTKLPDFTFKLLPLWHSALGDLWKLENSEVYKVFFIAPTYFVVMFKLVSIRKFCILHMP